MFKCMFNNIVFFSGLWKKEVLYKVLIKKCVQPTEHMEEKVCVKGLLKLQKVKNKKTLMDQKLLVLNIIYRFCLLSYLRNLDLF